jgi:hypothetical protein
MGVHSSPVINTRKSQVITDSVKPYKIEVEVESNIASARAGQKQIAAWEIERDGVIKW